MDQEFIVEPFKLIQDEISFGVARHLDNDKWEVIATFKFPLCAVKYFAECVLTVGVENKEEDNENSKENKD